MHLAYGRIAHLDMLQLANQTFWYAIQIFQYFKTVGFLVNYKRQILSGHNKRLCFVFVFCCLFYWKCSLIWQKEFGHISQIICRGETDVDICQKGQIWKNFTRLLVLLHINFNMLKIISFLNDSSIFGAETNDKDTISIKLFIITESVWPHIAISLK